MLKRANRQNRHIANTTTSNALSECARCAKWGPHFQFTCFERASIFSFFQTLSKVHELFIMMAFLLYGLHNKT